MMVWKMYLLLNIAIFGIYVKFLGCETSYQNDALLLCKEVTTSPLFFSTIVSFVSGWRFGMIYTPKTSMVPENRPSQQKTSLPIIRFQMRCVSFREGNNMEWVTNSGHRTTYTEWSYDPRASWKLCRLVGNLQPACLSIFDWDVVCDVACTCWCRMV